MGFIEIKSKQGNWHYININHIEEVIEYGEGCTIYLAFTNPHAEEQDYINTATSYDEIKTMIYKAVRG